jgi:multicomponent Na+:H+ antiporter subunit G
LTAPAGDRGPPAASLGAPLVVLALAVDTGPGRGAVKLLLGRSRWPAGAGVAWAVVA